MKSLLFVLSDGPHSTDALRSAVTVQKALGARLTVVHPTPRLVAAQAMGADGGVGLAVIEITEAEQAAAAAAARQSFDEVCGGDPTCRFRDTGMTPYETLRKQSLFADLIVLARDESERDSSLHQLKAALVTNRVPTLWLPPGPISAPPRTVACAWNGQAPSARAIKAARPFLALAKRLVIIEYAGDKVNHSRLENYLDVHGMKPADWRPYGEAGLSARARARSLMAEAKAAEADLLVMGAYGEMVESFFSFGRATEKVAEAATVPVLFSS